MLTAEFTVHFDFYNTQTVKVAAPSIGDLWLEFGRHMRGYAGGSAPVVVTCRIVPPPRKPSPPPEKRTA